MDPFSDLVMEENSLDQFLIHGGKVMEGVEEEEWTASQGELLMSDSQNEDLLSAARRAEQQGGNPLFQVSPERIHRPRPWQNGTVVQMAVRFRLEQLRSANGEFLGEAISEVFMQGLQQLIQSQNFQPVEEYSMSFQIHHNTGSHTWTSSPVISLTEWLEGSERTRAWLDKLTKQLNSSEGLDAAGGEFYAELLF